MTDEIEVVFIHDTRHTIMQDIQRFVGYLNLKMAKHLFPFDKQAQFEALNNLTPWKVNTDWW